jgi:hypothetical protein
MNVVAREASLTVYAPTNHNFAKIADVPQRVRCCDLLRSPSRR